MKIVETPLLLVITGAAMGACTGILLGYALAQPLRFFPDPKDFGTWAEWLNVCVAGLVGYAVFKLGRRTHEFQEMIAGKQAAQDAQERQLLLLYLMMELSDAAAKSRRLRAMVEDDDFASQFSGDADFRASISKAVDGIVLPLTAAKADRLHVIGNPEGAMIIRGVGLLPVLQAVCQGSIAEASDSSIERLAVLLPQMSIRLERDFETVVAACKAARIDAGLERFLST